MLIILDLDGTIIDSEKCHFNSFVKSLERNGFKVTKEIKDEIKNVFGMSAKEIIRIIIPKITEEKLELVADGVKNIAVNEEIGRVKLINGALEFIKKYNKNNDLAIITNSSQKFTKAILKALGLDEYFKLVVTPSLNIKPKPSGEMIEFAAKKLGYPNKDCILIGDSIYDFISAKNANIRFIAVLSKSDYKKELKKKAECFFDLSQVKI
ncbi:MAG: HAD family hydrolase [Candidatus Nanoarchaeia archaeon]|jgi:HAD superfamily hydrolase (TIGR01509 family)